MKKILILIAISLSLASCKEDNISPQYDNSPLTNTRWRTTGISLDFTSTHVTEKYHSLPPITKPYYLVGDMLHFYSINKTSGIKIEILSNKQSLIYNIYPQGGYQYYLDRY